MIQLAVGVAAYRHQVYDTTYHTYYIPAVDCCRDNRLCRSGNEETSAARARTYHTFLTYRMTHAWAMVGVVRV